MRGSLAALMLALILPLPALAGQVTVKPGETLSEIADRYGISVSRLMTLNGLKKANHVEAGMVLQVPGGGARSTASGSSGRSGGSVTVQRGQTLSEIAEQQGISLATLMRINGISDANQVVAGQKLSLGGGRSSSSSGGTSTARGGSVTVQRGQTLSEIAEQQGVSLSTLMRLNDISDANQVLVGQQLRLPGRATTAAVSAPPRYPQNASVHVVRQGESLSGIADGYNVSLSRLVALNAIADPNHVEPGTRLKLKGSPAPRPAASPTASVTPKPSAAVSKPVAAHQQPTPSPRVAAHTAPASSSQGASGTRASAAVNTAAAATTTSRPAQATASAQPTAQPSTRPATTAVASTPQTASQPAPNQGVSTQAKATAIGSASSTTAITSATSAAARPSERPFSSTAATTTAATAATTTATRPATRPAVTASATRPSGPVAMARADWRTYGPMQVNWTAWQPMGGSMVAPSLNAKGQTFYTAINCGARKLNATTVSGEWQTWSDPSAEYEQQLMSDYCRSRS